MKLSSPTRRRNEFLKMLDNTSENDEYDDDERSIASDGLIKTKGGYIRSDVILRYAYSFNI